jgi:anti-sigma regulatory factor (Ser/Thr protein kinase)
MHKRGHVVAVGRYRREPSSVAQARRIVAQAYAACPRIDHSLLALLVSEAATNAVLHADGPDFYVLCHSPSAEDGSVQVEVHDGSGSLPRPRQASDLDEHGRGLALLDLLAARWRTERTMSGKSVIFTVEAGKCPA